MEEREYSLKELAAEAGIDPRKIRFYIQEKLLSGPESRGRHARYTDYHLKRLRAIRTLSEVYKMTLKEIRMRLTHAGDEDIERVLRHGHGGHWRPHGDLPSAGMASRTRRASMARGRTAGSTVDDEFLSEEPAVFLQIDESVPSGKFTPLESLISRLKDALPAKKVSSSSRGESWRIIEITPELRLQVKDVFPEEEMARFEEMADYIREILLGADET